MRKKIIASILFLIIFITSTIVYAALDAKAEINPSAGNVKPGDEVTFTVKVKDISSDKGINGVEGIISYDTDKFEELKTENVTKASAWEVAYNKDNGKVIAEGITAVKENTDVIKVTLKVKNDSNLVGKNATISLSNVVAYNDEKVDIGTISASVKVVEESSSEPDTTPTPTTKPTSEPTAKPNGGSESTPTPSTKPNNTGAPTATAKPNSGENKNDVPITNINTNTGNSSSNKGNGSSGSSTSSSNKGTTSSSSLPKAGIGSTVTVLTVVAALLGTVSYIKLRKYREI